MNFLKLTQFANIISALTCFSIIIYKSYISHNDGNWLYLFLGFGNALLAFLIYIFKE